MDYRLSEGVTIECVDGCKILVTERGDAALINTTAEVIVDALLEQADLETAIQAIAATYESDEDAVRLDAEELIQELLSKDLIEPLPK